MSVDPAFVEPVVLVRTDTTDVRAARHATAQVLAPMRLPRTLVSDILLVVSELVTNVLRHVGPPVNLTLCRTQGPHVRIEVHDCSSGLPLIRSAQEGEGGWGLKIVRDLAATWGVDLTPDGKVVWAEFLLPPDGGDGARPSRSGSVLPASGV
jgi:anti-sigma regulatory factor (Ser/Thr protein kinase)